MPRRCASAASTSGGSDDGEPRRDRARAARSGAARAPAALAGDRQRRLHRLAPASKRCCGCGQDVVEPRQFLDRPSQQPRRGARRGRRRRAGGATRSSKATSPTRTPACAPASGVDIVLHEAALGSVPRSIDDPLRDARRQRHRLSQHARRRARRGRRALRLRRVELDLRRPSRAAEGRGRDRPAAVAVCRHQVS